MPREMTGQSFLLILEETEDFSFLIEAEKANHPDMRSTVPDFPQYGNNWRDPIPTPSYTIYNLIHFMQRVESC